MSPGAVDDFVDVDGGEGACGDGARRHQAEHAAVQGTVVVGGASTCPSAPTDLALTLDGQRRLQCTAEQLHERLYLCTHKTPQLKPRKQQKTSFSTKNLSKNRIEEKIFELFLMVSGKSHSAENVGESLTLAKRFVSCKN